MAYNPERSYTYPNHGTDPDRQDVLRNRLGIESHEQLRSFEYEQTRFRQAEMDLGGGPQGSFDAAHLKAIHEHLFQDVYEWAGHTRNERPTIDGVQVEPVGNLSKGGTSFLHGSRIDMGLNEALKPISNPDVLRGSTPAEFAERAGAVLSELNFVHAFREGNGRTNEAFIKALGREYGHEVEFEVITKPRMIEASIETTNDPSSRAMAHLIADATEPGRRDAIRSSFEDLRALGEDPMQHNVRTAAAGERVTGAVLRDNHKTVSVVTERGIIAAQRDDLPRELARDDSDVSFTARSDFERSKVDETARSSPVREDDYER
ncbi:Fic/DOC family protein [Aureimonas altamirensis]|uniref:Fic/DOC family protein n=1 Tax=Aureimonas altamirensis TaxID=370622 RepID=UPI002555CEDC|nr:Fic family protein [Aureimonas altamirensis]